MIEVQLSPHRIVETPVTVNNNSPIEDYVHPDDQSQIIFEITPWFKSFTVFLLLKAVQIDMVGYNSPYNFNKSLPIFCL